MLKLFWASLKENKKIIYFAGIIFVISVIFGYYYSDIINNLAKEMLAQIEGIAEEIEAHNSVIYMIYLIFKKNVIAATAMILLGSFFAITPVIFLFINGALIGYLLKLIIVQYGQGITFFLVGILPHGILELPAIIIAAAYGMKLGYAVFQALIGKTVIFKNLIKQLPIVILGIIVILFVAAIIESTITGYLLTKFFTI